MKHVPDSKFKLGDRVVRTLDGYWNKGTKAVIVRLPDIEFPDDYLVSVEGDAITYEWHFSRMEFEHVFSSPLYKALK